MKRETLLTIVVILLVALVMGACNKSTPAPTPTSNPQPTPTQSMPTPKPQPTPTQESSNKASAEMLDFEGYLDKALDAAKANDTTTAKNALENALKAAKDDAQKSFVQELLDDVEKGNLDEVAEDIQTYLGSSGTPTFESLLDKAMDAAKAGDADKAKEELSEALDLAQNDAQKSFVQELLDDVEKGNLDEVAEDIDRYLAQGKQGVSPEIAQKAAQLYVQKGCFACHGAKYEGGDGPIPAGISEARIKNMVRSGNPEGGMPKFDKKTLSDQDLDILAEFLSSLSLEDTGVQIPDSVAKHLQAAWSALQSGDKNGVETHLKAAQEAAKQEKAGEGLQTTIAHMLEALNEPDWQEHVADHLHVLVGQ